MGGLALRPAAQASTYAPPSYANPAAYQESEFTVGTDQWALPGILTMPVGPGPVPAVVLVHGSGPGDRDATVGQIKQFKDLALGLASRGIAVLRFDKRVRVHANAMREGAGRTVKEETIEDGPRRGAITRKYATRGSPSQLRARAQPWWYARAEASRREVADGRLHRHGRRGATPPARARRAVAVSCPGRRHHQPGGTGADRSVRTSGGARRRLGPADASKPDLIAGATASYWLDLRGYDPPAAAAEVAQPMLVLQGERDYQVTMEEFKRWRSALADRTT